MSYTPTNWKTGDVVTSSKLNKLENGVADAGGGGVLIVHCASGVLDKTWQEINDALPLVFVMDASGTYGLVMLCEEYEGFRVLVQTASYVGDEDIYIKGTEYVANTADDYPTDGPK